MKIINENVDVTWCTPMLPTASRLRRGVAHLSSIYCQLCGYLQSKKPSAGRRVATPISVLSRDASRHTSVRGTDARRRCARLRDAFTDRRRFAACWLLRLVTPRWSRPDLKIVSARSRSRLGHPISTPFSFISTPFSFSSPALPSERTKSCARQIAPDASVCAQRKS